MEEVKKRQCWTTKEIKCLESIVYLEEHIATAKAEIAICKSKLKRHSTASINRELVRLRHILGTENKGE